MDIVIHTPTRNLFTGEGSEIVAPSVCGEVGILPGHVDYVTLLKEGAVRVGNGSRTQEYTIAGGILSVQGDRVTVLVETPSS